jgi:predicted 3-demethylubiquinone-9 3-methyltransferase (glyoxalase superfamily)
MEGTMPATITTFLMFQGRAEEALMLYTSLFKDAEVLSVSRYGPGEPGAEGSVKHARFTLAGQEFMCVDSNVRHDFTFTPAMSLYVECDSEDEIDGLYTALGDGGGALMPLGEHGIGRKFGWISDRFGVSWQLSLP